MPIYLMKHMHLKQRTSLGLYASSEIRLGIQIQSECSQTHIHLCVQLHKAASYMVQYRQCLIWRTQTQRLNIIHSADSCRMFPTILFTASGFLQIQTWHSLCYSIRMLWHWAELQPSSSQTEPGLPGPAARTAHRAASESGNTPEDKHKLWSV